MTEKNKKKYSRAEKKEICDMLKDGKTLKYIAKRMGRSIDAIKQVVHRLKKDKLITEKELPKRRKRQVKVQCVETGEVYETLIDAANAMGCSAPTIADRLKKGTPIIDADCKEFHLIEVGRIKAKKYKS